MAEALITNGTSTTPLDGNVVLDLLNHINEINDSLFSKEIECLEAKHQDSTSLTTDVCPVDWDSLLCWPKAPAGTHVKLPCFDQLYGIRYDSSRKLFFSLNSIQFNLKLINFFFLHLLHYFFFYFYLCVTMSWRFLNIHKRLWALMYFLLFVLCNLFPPRGRNGRMKNVIGFLCLWRFKILDRKVFFNRQYLFFSQHFILFFLFFLLFIFWFFYLFISLLL